MMGTNAGQPPAPVSPQRRVCFDGRGEPLEPEALFPQAQGARTTQINLALSLSLLCPFF